MDPGGALGSKFSPTTPLKRQNTAPLAPLRASQTHAWPVLHAKTLSPARVAPKAPPWRREGRRHWGASLACDPCQRPPRGAPRPSAPRVGPRGERPQSPAQGRAPQGCAPRGTVRLRAPPRGRVLDTVQEGPYRGSDEGGHLTLGVFWPPWSDYPGSFGPIGVHLAPRSQMTPI